MSDDFSLEMQVERGGSPIGVISLFSLPPKKFKTNFFYVGSQEPVHCLKVEFDYDGVRVPSDHSEVIVEVGADRVVCNRKEELEFLTHFDVSSYPRITTTYHWISGDDPRRALRTCRSDAEWMTFTQKKIPELREAGWLVEIDPTFTLSIHAPEQWYVDLQEKAGGQFDAQIGFELSNQRINILPFLLKRLRGELTDGLLTLEDGRKVLVPAERIELLTTSLLELFDKDAVSKNAESIEIPWIRAMELAQFQALEDFTSELPLALRKNADRLLHVTNAPAVPISGKLNATLRDYQHLGVNWLQLLREMNFGAVLADDMGLGKTVQALAHILAEKDAGRMKEPCLIIAPTSVLYNWESEAKKFAPSLRVHVSHGSERADHFEKFAEFDLIVTSYPLLSRDGEALLKHSFHLLILDEAQFVRNHRTIASRVVRLFKAKQRIALTGTPLENNLDELWSLFSFVMPGLLGSQTVFRKYFRHPIEKMDNPTARRVLARRIAPFMLRRTKDEVMQELPPKTEIIQRIELTQSQKELYEMVRAGCEERVQEAVKEKGLARSHIIVLDALLKMRQVCCHPQLLKLEAARPIKESAKLTALSEMLQEMVPEGRRILLFSQFTSMLKLIEAHLKNEKISYVKITGQTKDRQTPIATFQAGKASVFLISLKAGGTGLNLTAADTVIHFDPWWNPAAENQATDRAHRIGQEKPVFVYKLIAAGTVEESVLAMQEKKKDLIDGLLGEQKKALAKWSEKDVAAFFAPLDNAAGE